MNADGKSDDFVVLTTQANKTATVVAESVEERRSPKGSDALHVIASDTEPKCAIIPNVRASTTSSNTEL